MRTNLRNRRLEKNLSQAELGRQIGLDQRTISALELGRLKGPVETWDKLEKALDIDQRLLRQTDSQES
jgi:transcriptional regulator with XRE-family HTH domain